MSEEIKNVTEETQAEAPVQKETKKAALNASVAPEEFDWDAFENEGTDQSTKAETLAQYEQTLSKVTENEVVEGVVTSINKREVVVNIGAKSEGVISAPEFRYNPDLKAGDKVVMIPNVPVERSDVRAENYLRSSLFRGSSMDGFMQEYIETVPDRLVAIPDTITNDLVAAFTEMVSVVYHALSRFDRTAHQQRETIGVWGDGNMGYFTALLLKARFPRSKVIVFGVIESKLADFSFADDICLVSQIPKNLTVDHAFECVGGNAAGSVINQIIDHIAPEGTIGLLGVSEDPVPINTRMVLEKGLRLLGTSRSGREDFEGLVRLYSERSDVVEYLEKMVGGVVKVRSIADITNAFEMDIYKQMGKTIMEWS